MRMLRHALMAVTLLAALAACDDEPDDGPYVEFAGGGFVFNYNLAQAYYGFVLRALRRIPAGTVIEAEFEDPSGGPPIVERQTARESGVEYTFRTPAVEGVKAGRDYRVVVRLIDPGGGELLGSYGRAFRSSADQDILPKKPLTVGPGYQENPESEYATPQPAQQQN